jgi:hypothetical protein
VTCDAQADPAAFATLKALRANPELAGDAVQRRQVEVLYLAYLEKQGDPSLLRQIVELVS